MAAVVGVAVGSATIRAAALDRDMKTLMAGDVVRSFGTNDPLGTAEALLASMVRKHFADGYVGVIAVPDDAAMRRGTNAYQTHGSHDVRLVSELGAQLAFLQYDGRMTGTRTVAICDLGASGTTISIADPDTGAVFRAERTVEYSGDACDDIIVEYLRTTYCAAELTSDDALDALEVAARLAREELSTGRVSEINGPFANGPIRLWRSTFESLVEKAIARTTGWIASVIADAPRAVDSLILVGGNAHAPALQFVLQRDLRMPVIVPSAPEFVTAHGAALIASNLSGGFGGTTRTVPQRPTQQPAPSRAAAPLSTRPVPATYGRHEHGAPQFVSAGAGVSSGSRRHLS